MGEPTKTPRNIGGFELITRIGQGGMGAVFKARQMSLDRVVALKVLPPSVAKDTKFIERFQREARACARLNHPNIVQGVDVGQDAATGVWYFAMELVEGPSVGQVLKLEKVLPEKRALEIVRDVAKALECAASHGVVHRDIKPDNILLTEHDGEAKLADLGLARQINDDASVTQSGQAVGTPYYMAPEQVRGQADKCDTRTDIYALGATLYHLVTGETPYKGETGAVIMAHHLTDPVPKAHKTNPDVSEGCSRLIERMMQKSREQRIQTPGEVLTQIEKLLHPEVGSATTSAQRATGAQMSTRRRKEGAPPKSSIPPLALLGIGVVIVIVAVFALKGSSGAPAKSESKPAESKTAATEPPKTPQPVAPALPSPPPPSAPATTPAPAPKEAVKESLPTAMLPAPAPVAADDGSTPKSNAEKPATPEASLPGTKAPATTAAETPAKPAMAAPPPEKVTPWPLAEILSALHDNAPAKALEQAKNGNHPGQETMLAALKAVVAQREARFAAIKNLIGQNVKLDTPKGPQNGKLVSFENGTLGLEREYVINGESKGASKGAVAFDDLTDACVDRIAPIPAPANSTDWLATSLSALADKQLDAAETALTHVDAGELVGSSRVDLQACKLEYSIVSPK